MVTATSHFAQATTIGVRASHFDVSFRAVVLVLQVPRGSTATLVPSAFVHILLSTPVPNP